MIGTYRQRSGCYFVEVTRQFLSVASGGVTTTDIPFSRSRSAIASASSLLGSLNILVKFILIDKCTPGCGAGNSGSGTDAIVDSTASATADEGDDGATTSFVAVVAACESSESRP